MKKTFLILILNLLSFVAFAQKSYLYVVFQVGTDTENDIKHWAWKNYSTQFYRYRPHAFSVKQSGVIRTFLYANQTSQPDEPAIMQPTSFLDTIEYLDWNREVMNYSSGEFYIFLNSLSTYDKVYFIDRSEIKDGMMKMYPVKEMKSRY